jgi:hypothetical protein
MGATVRRLEVSPFSSCQHHVVTAPLFKGREKLEDL